MCWHCLIISGNCEDKNRVSTRTEEQREVPGAKDRRIYGQFLAGVGECKGKAGSGQLSSLVLGKQVSLWIIKVAQAVFGGFLEATLSVTEFNQRIRALHMYFYIDVLISPSFILLFILISSFLPFHHYLLKMWWKYTKNSKLCQWIPNRQRERKTHLIVVQPSWLIFCFLVEESEAMINMHHLMWWVAW